MSTAVLIHISLFLPSVAVPLIHMELFFLLIWDKDYLVSRLVGNTMYKMNNHNKVIQLESMAVSSLHAAKVHLEKVPSFHCNTYFSLVPVILSLPTFCGGK